VAEEENSRAKTEDLCGQAQIGIHGERGEADVHPIQEREKVQHAKEWDQAPSELAHRRSSDGVINELRHCFPKPTFVVSPTLRGGLIGSRTLCPDSGCRSGPRLP